MFTLEEYKEKLISFYRWEMDASNEKKNKRKEILSIRYPDNFLENIIKNTWEFIYFLLTKMEEEHRVYKNHIFFTLELPYECILGYSKEIYLNLGGGWPSDTLFFIENENKLISKTILREFFKNFMITTRIEESEYYDEKTGIGSLLETPYFYISGSLEEFDNLVLEIRHMLGKSLCYTLKRVNDISK